jgi:hypothetical protein
MGELADMAIEAEERRQLYGYCEEPYRRFSRLPFIHKKKLFDRRTFIWTDKQGKRYFMDEITDSHLVNIIRYLKAGKGTLSDKSIRKDLIKWLEEEAKDVRHIKLDK